MKCNHSDISIVYVAQVRRTEGDRDLSATDVRGLLETQGAEKRRIFGIDPRVRLQRQVTLRATALTGRKLICNASCVLGDATLDWMIEHPGHLVVSRQGRSRAVVVNRDATVDLGGEIDTRTLAAQGLVAVAAADLGETYSRKLRRRHERLFRSLAEDSVAEIEYALFRNVYKGVTDIVTHYLWPIPAYHVTRLFSRLGITANLVTISGILLTLFAAVEFYHGHFALGLVAGWLMTFFDTVDGKLARVTCTSSKLGDKLDHIPDLLHPPAWWACFALGLIETNDPDDPVLVSCIVILATYVLGRLCEAFFKKRHGFNQYMWTPFDSALRMVVARRNVILLMLTLGVIAGRADLGFQLAALWSVFTILIQPVRVVQANRALQHGRIPKPWL